MKLTMKKEKEVPRSSHASPKTMESREMMLSSLAMDLLEQRLRDGTATSQEVCAALKYGSERERLEQEKLRNESALKQAQIESIHAAETQEETYKNAIAAMSSYRSTSQ